MKYMGSKKRLQKYLVPIINKEIKDGGFSLYVEPFVGGANMIEAIDCETKVGYDNNLYLIEMLKYVVNYGIDESHLPTRISRDLYSKVREDYNSGEGSFTESFIGWIGFMASYNGRFFSGGYSGHEVKGRDYIREAINNLKNQIVDLKDVQFYHSDYRDIEVKGALIYCDPPYKDSKKYDTSRDFGHDEFYLWCRKMAEHNTVLISEYTLPEDGFELVWEKELNVNLMDTQGGKRKKKSERLYRARPIK